MELKKELIKFIKENHLSPFNLYKTPVKSEEESIYKTRDGKSVHNRVLSNISNYFCFSDSSNLFNCFEFTKDINKIKERQEFFRTVPKDLDNNFLKNLKKPKQTWKPKYSVVAVTDDEDTFSKLKNLDVPVKFLLNEQDVLDLENYEIVQAVDVEQFSSLIEQLPQSVFLDSIDDVYLERYLEILSSWKDNLEILKNINDNEILQIVLELKPILGLTQPQLNQKISRNEIEQKLGEINEEISLKLKNMNVSGDILFEMLSKNKLPIEIEKIIDDSVKKTNVPEHLFDLAIPVKIDENEFENFIRLQDANENTDFAEKIKKNASLLKKIPEKLERLCELMIIYDFSSGISRFMLNQENGSWPIFSQEFTMENSKNVFLESPQAISFSLSLDEKCSILTGANSGGKTTLIEHIIQIISLFNLGLPTSGNVKIPIFSEVYYFAKNKGSANKGAFETLLTQMSKIEPGTGTIILADEIEAVTEPGVAGKIISATSSYFIEKNCFLVIATHLGYEIKDILPQKARIDGIEAKGLNENNELIVDHNPVLGRLANSTPELIVEKLANSEKQDYFKYLNRYLKENTTRQ
ncbi:DNA-binding protein MutS2 [uncultured archaeon]|nr:DNA-binding protein MutS2 [uncultured archaeon]